jgi:cytochrome c oxidase subunit 1
MNTMTVEKANAPAASESFLRDALAWWSDTNPRRLACRHLGLAVMWLTLGLVSALILRLEMLTPALDMMQARTFGALLSLHGALMFYFVALPLIPGALGQFLLARWLPDEQVVFPRLNRLAWQLLAVGGMLVAGGFVLGGTEVGWGLEAGFGGRFNQGGTLPLAAGVLCASVSMGLNALNFLAGLRQLRRHGFPGGGARVMAESLGCASLLGVVAGPFLGVAMILVLADVLFGWSVFSPAWGGDPQLFVVLFRFFYGPAQNMLLLLALGVTLGVVSDRVRAAPFGRGLYIALLAMVVAGLAGWGAELVTASSGQPVTLLGGNPLQGLVFAAFLFCLVVLLRNLRSGVRTVDTALLYALAFWVTAAQGLGLGLLLATPVGAAQFGNTQLASAQMHIMMLAVSGMAVLSGLHAHWTDLTGRTYADGLGRVLALLVWVGTGLTFAPLCVLGLQGVSYRANAYPASFQVWQVMSTAGSTVLLVSLFLAVLNLVVGRRAAGSAVRAMAACAVLLALGSGCADKSVAQPASLQVKVTGMHCESCAQTITKKLKRGGGVQATDVHFSNDVQTIHYDAARLQISDIVNVITQLGYSAELVIPSPEG